MTLSCLFFALSVFIPSGLLAQGNFGGSKGLIRSRENLNKIIQPGNNTLTEAVRQALEQSVPKAGRKSTEMSDQHEQGQKEQPGSQELDIEVKKDTNHKLDFNVLDTNIRHILSSLAMACDINIVMSKDVKGDISVHLNNVSLQEALRGITMAGGYDYSVHGKDMYYVFEPEGDYKPDSEREKVKVFEIDYASLDKIEEILDSMTESGLVKVHEESQTVMIQDTPEKIAQMEAVIKKWDTLPEQVLIEAKILEIKLTKSMDFGVDWEQVLGDVEIGTGGFTTGVMPDGGGTSPVPSDGTGLFANIITAAGTRHQFKAALDFLKSKTEVHSLSTPKLLAIHGKPARVQIGGEQGYKVTTLSEEGATENVEFIQTGTILEITPYINSDKILLEAKPSINSAEIIEGVPKVTSTNVSTWLLADNGQTVFIGGLLKDHKTRDRSTVPCLGSIPGISPLFGSSQNTREKTERVILITPYIVGPAHQRNFQSAIEDTKKLEEKFKNQPELQEKELLEQFLYPNRQWGETEEK